MLCSLSNWKVKAPDGNSTMQVVRAVVSGLRHPVSSSHSVAATSPLSSRTYAQYAHSISTWLIPSWSANVNRFCPPWHHCRVDNLPCSSLSSSLSWTWGFQILPGLSWSAIIVFTKYTYIMINHIIYIYIYIHYIAMFHTIHEKSDLPAVFA